MSSTLAQQLEAGEIVRLAPCAGLVPNAADRDFLCAQRWLPGSGKYIAFSPHYGRATGFVQRDDEQARRLTSILAAFSQRAQAWLAELLPPYAQAFRPDQATWRTEEEATRRLSQSARGDLLHVDAFASRPTEGARILRLFVNLHATDPRVWATSETFGPLLERFGDEAPMPAPESGWASRWGQGLMRLFRPGDRARGEYDRFMLRFQHFLKLHEEYQERAPRSLWRFAPGEAWLAFTDGLAHADLRGQFALEHSFLVPLRALVRPEFAPVAILQSRCSNSLLPHAA